MPDLDVIYVQVCAITSLQDQVSGSKGETYEVHVQHDENFDHCTCMGFQFRRTCKHVKALREKLCGWHEQLSDEKQTPQQEMEGVCPKCGGETTVIRMGV